MQSIPIRIRREVGKTLEPATYAIILGAAALGYAVIRLKRILA